nr:hypothetical protein [Primorskyibacter flagellatus]
MIDHIEAPADAASRFMPRGVRQSIACQERLMQGVWANRYFPMIWVQK